MTTDNSVQAELPRYRSHKTVWALKISHVLTEGQGGGAILTPEDNRYVPFKVSGEYMMKHKPEVGGFYVVYEDGYKSFSPAAAFESGYTPTKLCAFGFLLDPDTGVLPDHPTPREAARFIFTAADRIGLMTSDEKYTDLLTDGFNAATLSYHQRVVGQNRTLLEAAGRSLCQWHAQRSVAVLKVLTA